MAEIFRHCTEHHVYLCLVLTKTVLMINLASLSYWCRPLRMSIAGDQKWSEMSNYLRGRLNRSITARRPRRHYHCGLSSMRRNNLLAMIASVSSSQERPATLFGLSATWRPFVVGRQVGRSIAPVLSAANIICRQPGREIP